jgi:hypothetical protein
MLHVKELRNTYKMLIDKAKEKTKLGRTRHIMEG